MAEPDAEIAPMIDPVDFHGRVIADRYRVDNILGEGGMGTVYAGEQMSLHRPVAIKVLAPEFSEDEHLRARFEREARSTARLEHPNIVQVLELGATEEGFLFIVMQLLDGEDLSNFITGPLDPLRAVEFQLQILRALEHAHRQGVVHRDLKPDNVFVTRDDDGNEVLKLLDFGIAKIVNPRGHEDPSATPITQIGLVFGTPQYMSPEQATGMEADARTDIYSAGLILYALLTGAPPFDGDDLVAVTRMQVSVEPPPLPDTLPEALRAFVSKMTAKDRDQRYQSAEEARLVLETMRVDLLSMAETPDTPAPPYEDDVVRAFPPESTITPVEPHPAAPGDESWDGIDRRETPRGPGRGRIVAVAAAALLTLAVFVGMNSGTSRLEGEEILQTDVSQEVIAEIDRALTADDPSAALRLIQPLRDEHPEDPILAWKAGRALSMKSVRTNGARALGRYERALTTRPELLDVPEFFAELSELMRQRKIRGEAINLALQRLGESGHPFLLEQINNPKTNRVLSYTDRGRILEALQEVDDSAALIDWDLNLAQHLQGARKTDAPCANLQEVLAQISSHPSRELYEALKRLREPRPSDAESAEVCAATSDAMKATLAGLAEAFPPEDSTGASKG